jgi:hypothetical protein
VATERYNGDVSTEALRAVLASDDARLTIAALQLLPENALWLGLLEQLAGAADVAAARVPEDFEPGSAPDLWATEILFPGGSFLAPLGHDPEAELVVRHLILGLYALERPLNGGAAQRIRRLLEAALTFAELVMRRARVNRHTLSVEGEFVVPDQARLAELKQAAVVPEADLTRLLGYDGAEALAPLIADDLADLTRRPLIRDEGQLILALPHHLLPSLAEAIVAAGGRPEMATRHRKALTQTVHNCALVMGWRPLALELPLSELDVTETVWRADIDKLIHVVLVSDAEGDDDPIWRVDQIAPALAARLDEVAGVLAEQGDVLHLVLIQGLVRPFVLAGLDRVGDTLELALSVADFELISYLEPDALTLWKYVDALARLAAHTEVAVVADALDAFAAWREAGQSFYFSDEPLPDGIVFAEAGGELRRELRRKRDFHGVRYVERDRMAWVTRAESELPVPIYTPAPGYADRPALVVEGLPLPLWVFTRLPLPDSLLARAVDYVDTVAYWLWQLTDDLRPLAAAIGNTCHQLWVEVGFADEAAWLADRQDDGPPFTVTTDGRCRVLVHLRPPVVELVATADNRGERELMRAIVAALSDLAAANWPAARVDESIDRVAPLGVKKKMIALDIGADVRLDPRNLPPLRLLSAADLEAALDEVGAHLAERYPVGGVAVEERTRVLRHAVAFHFAEIERLVGELSPDGLLERLVGANEAIVAEQARGDLTAPTVAACYSGIAEKTNELRESIPKLSQAAVAARFLIEYVAARPPGGSAPLTLSRFDRLMAHASELVNRGSLSDALHLGLENSDVSITPARRLGVSRETPFWSGRELFLSAHAREELAQRQRRFARLWDEMERPEEPPEEVVRLDAAVRSEFGFALTELRDLIGALSDAAVRRESGPVVVRKNELQPELAESLGWAPERVDEAIALFALEERAAFDNPPTHRREETYPWRFSREFSYVRRPLIFRTTGEGTEVVYGLRHLQNAWMNFANLIIGGRLRAQTPELLQEMTRLRHDETSSFVERVADLYRDESTIVRTNVLRIAGRRLRRDDGSDLGDVDVLAATPATRLLEAVEVKDLSVARTPRELANELKETFASGGARRSHAEIHAERVVWLERNLAEVLDWLGLDGGEVAKWRVVGSIVVDEPLMSPYVHQAPLPVTGYGDLAAERGVT